MLLKDSFAAPLTDVKSLRKGKQLPEISSNSKKGQGKINQLLIEKVLKEAGEEDKATGK